MRQEIEDAVVKLNSDFSASNLANFMKRAGWSEIAFEPEAVDFNRFVFLQSSSDEVYGRIERQFISQIKSIFVFPETHKSIARGSIICSVVAVDLSDSYPDIYGAVLFMKIVTKVLDGWTLFILQLSDGIHIGMRVFDRDEKKNCILCEKDALEDVLDEIMWQDGNRSFLPFYNSLLEVIRPQDKNLLDYDEAAVKRRGIQYDYIDTLREISIDFNLDFSYEIERYTNWYEKAVDNTFYSDLEDALDALREIKSSRVNTLEMLFEAEELERITNENEQKYLSTISQQQTTPSYDFSGLESVKNDPEAMIKMLKANKGIF